MIALSLSYWIPSIIKKYNLSSDLIFSNLSDDTSTRSSFNFVGSKELESARDLHEASDCDLGVGPCVNRNIGVLNWPFVWWLEFLHRAVLVAFQMGERDAFVCEVRGGRLRKGRWKRRTAPASRECVLRQMNFRKENIWKLKVWKWIPLKLLESVYP